MKKLYILAFSLLSVAAAQAQTITIYDANGNEVADGATVTITAPSADDTEEDEDNPGSFWYLFDSGLTMKGSADGKITIAGSLVEQTASGEGLGTLSYQVCPEGSCVPFTNDIAINEFDYKVSKGVIPMEIHISTGNTAVSKFILKSTAEYNVYYTANEDSVKSFTLVFDYDYSGAGVNDIAVDTTNAPAEYFNLQGVRVTNPTAGQLLIKRQGTKVTKEIIK